MTIELKNHESTLVAARLDALCALLALTRTVGTLKKYPSCTHWHVKKPGQTGTLELTLWPAGSRFWIERRSNRSAAWQDEVVDALIREFGPA